MASAVERAWATSETARQSSGAPDGHGTAFSLTAPAVRRGTAAGLAPQRGHRAPWTIGGSTALRCIAVHGSGAGSRSHVKELGPAASQRGY